MQAHTPLLDSCRLVVRDMANASINTMRIETIVPNSMDVCDLGCGSGPPRLHTGGANILWVQKNQGTRGERLQIATYNVRTLLNDEHV